MLFSLIGLVGCVGPSKNASWKDRFTPGTKTSNLRAYGGTTACTQFYDRDAEGNIKEFIANGYESIGISLVGSFGTNLASAQSIEELKLFGQSIGADHISFGLAKEEYQPRFNDTLRLWVANFWRKSAPDSYDIQARFRDLTESEARMVGSRGNAYVLLVIKNGPAYEANIFEGDVVTEINGERVQDAKELRAKCKALGGSELTMTILRAGMTMKKKIRLYPQIK